MPPSVDAAQWTPPPPAAADSSNPGSGPKRLVCGLLRFRRASRVRLEGPRCALDCLASAAARRSARWQALVIAGGATWSRTGSQGQRQGFCGGGGGSSGSTACWPQPLLLPR